MKNLRFAFAIGDDNLIAETKFSDASMIRIYEYLFTEKCLNFISEEINPVFEIKDHDEKVSILIDFLSSNNIDLLVAKKYGIMIEVENKYFVPIVVSNSSPQRVVELITKQINWLYDELELEKKEHMIIRIDKGVFKYKL
ncbi:MAG: hypothetical protein ACERKD_00530 [Prolixibacteraceae bacterium]